MNGYSDIDKKVSFYIQGKHGKIGIVIPENEPTEEEWREFIISLVELAVSAAKHKQIALRKGTDN